MSDLKIQKALLACGILGAVLYVAMTLFVGMLWEGYSPASQSVSELSAIDAPTRSLWIALGAVYSALIAAFGWGVWTSARLNRPVRIVGGLILDHALVAITWPPMHQREVLAAGRTAA